MRVVVTGAAGWIGQKVGVCLAARGCSVIGADILEQSVFEARFDDKKSCWDEYHRVEITCPIDNYISGVDAVVHCAGYAHRPNETAYERKKFYAVNREGTKHVLDWSERFSVKRFLYVSSIAFYDWESPEDLVVGEEHPVKLSSHYAKSKYEGEVLVRESLLDWRVVRLATVFGDGDRANFSRMARIMKKRMFPIPGKGEARKSVIPVDLAAELIADFILLDNPPHRLINVGLPSAPSLDEITEAYRKICGFPKCLKLPMPVARAMGAGGSLAAKILGKFPFTLDTLRKLTTDTVVSVDRMLECFPEREFEDFDEYLGRCASYYSDVV
ncbi:NAD(P)-dependent oxidoreductase [Akkermansiaceae bacterium]|nr:NAD(P)-dependent oxidoreductase [Akkermansiaceae bacterium]